ncbi:MAG: actin-binding WH2 domain-containing protein, partial [Armatimonadota bacterium]
GVSVGGWQILYNPIKMPWGMVFTLALCLPCLYIFSSYLGSRLSLAQTCTIAFTATAVMSTILIGFAPVTWFFMFTAPGAYEFGILINVLVFAISGFFGVQFLFRAAGAMTPNRSAESPIIRMLKWWVILYAVVGAQMGWLLRPFFNATDVFIRPRSGNFFVSVLRTLWVFLGGSGG